MKRKVFILTNLESGDTSTMTERDLEDWGVDEFIVDDAYENEEITFEYKGTEYTLESPEIYDTVSYINKKGVK